MPLDIQETKCLIKTFRPLLQEKRCWLKYPGQASEWWDAKIALRQREEWEVRDKEKDKRYGKKTEERKKEERISKVFNFNL